MAKPAPTKARSEGVETLRFLLKLALIVLIVRSFVFAPYSIPSESMLPRLLIGDYLFVTKWNYGFSRWSLPWGWPLIPGRVLPHTPARGDVVVFRSPPAPDEHDVIKRVIGLPGDTIQVRRGQVILNGVAIPRQRVADFIVPVTPNYRCEAAYQDTERGGRSAATSAIARRCRAGAATTCSTAAMSPTATTPTSIPCPPATSS